MRRTALKTLRSASFCLGVALATAQTGQAQETRAQYPSMAPLDQYLMERGAEIALARSAAPASISNDAEVIVFSRRGYESAAKGKNGFVCLVQRSWAAGFDDPEFWSPKPRAPICLNPAAVRTYLPMIITKTGSVLAGRSKAQVFTELNTAFDKKELRTLEAGAMGYMMSKQAYLNDRDGRWRPHLMFFVPLTDESTWGAGLPGSPLIGFKSVQERHTMFFLPLATWSDGTPATP